jgi:NAD(P)-dependent dehydrogenase (short-subunit alcohol dehydrogenase family)
MAYAAMKASTLFDVSGLVTVVTGGASGIGLAYAEAMADNGARVILFDLDRARLDTEAKRLGARGVHVDVTDRDALNRAFDGAARAERRLDVVFANAGVGGGSGFLTLDNERNPDRAFEKLEPDYWRRIFELDVEALFWTIQAAAKHMKAGQGGRIIVTSSISATKTESHVGAPYVAAKAAAAQLVRQAALELAEYNILVNAIAPGPFVTNISGGRLKDESVQAALAKYCPLKRLGFADDIQGLALFLASPASKYMTGASLTVDGGVTLGYLG